MQLLSLISDDAAPEIGEGTAGMVSKLMEAEDREDAHRSISGTCSERANQRQPHVVALQILTFLDSYSLFFGDSHWRSYGKPGQQDYIFSGMRWNLLISRWSENRPVSLSFYLQDSRQWSKRPQSRAFRGETRCPSGPSGVHMEIASGERASALPGTSP